MREYGKSDLLRLARRYHNTKRNYLLVDPLQGKHIPVRPGECLEMLRTLGGRLAEAAPDVDLVIGFAETATAVGAAVARELGPGCRYVQTTREAFAISPDAVSFQEEHSHATDQFLCLGDFEEALKNAKAVAFVDDEISTGKTLLNIIHALRSAYPGMEKKPVWAVSVINRLDDSRAEAFEREGVRCCRLLHLPFDDYTASVQKYAIHEAPVPEEADGIPVLRISADNSTCDARLGVDIREYDGQCRAMAEAVLRQIGDSVRGKSVTVLGTEEYMMPGLILGERLEQSGLCAGIDYHATTRSPIGICEDEEYPIRSGFRLHSFYEAGRPTYIYDLLPAQAVVIVTDSPDDGAAEAALRDIARAVKPLGCGQIILVREAKHVRHL